MVRTVISALAALVILSGAAWAEPAEKYVVLEEQPKTLPAGQAEAALFFWYGCGGCYRVETALAKGAPHWPEGARLIRMPAVSNPVWRFHGQIFLALEKMGAGPQTHLAVFDAFQNKGVRVMAREDLPDFIQRLGLDYQAFIKAFDSPEVTNRLNEIKRLMGQYDIRLVPAMVVEGKYKFDLGQVDGPAGFMAQTEELLKLAGEN